MNTNHKGSLSVKGYCLSTELIKKRILSYSWALYRVELRDKELGVAYYMVT